MEIYNMWEFACGYRDLKGKNMVREMKIGDRSAGGGGVGVGEEHSQKHLGRGMPPWHSNPDTV